MANQHDKTDGKYFRIMHIQFHCRLGYIYNGLLTWKKNYIKGYADMNILHTNLKHFSLNNKTST